MTRPTTVGGVLRRLVRLEYDHDFDALGDLAKIGVERYPRMGRVVDYLSGLINSDNEVEYVFDRLFGNKRKGK